MTAHGSIRLRTNPASLFNSVASDREVARSRHTSLRTVFRRPIIDGNPGGGEQVSTPTWSIRTDPTNGNHVVPAQSIAE